MRAEPSPPLTSLPSAGQPPALPDPAALALPGSGASVSQLLAAFPDTVEGRVAMADAFWGRPTSKRSAETSPRVSPPAAGPQLQPSLGDSLALPPALSEQEWPSPPKHPQKKRDQRAASCAAARSSP